MNTVSDPEAMSFVQREAFEAAFEDWYERRYPAPRHANAAWNLCLRDGDREVWMEACALASPVPAITVNDVYDLALRNGARSHDEGGDQLEICVTPEALLKIVQMALRSRTLD